LKGPKASTVFTCDKSSIVYEVWSTGGRTLTSRGQTEVLGYSANLCTKNRTQIGLRSKLGPCSDSPPPPRGSFA